MAEEALHEQSLLEEVHVKERIGGGGQGSVHEGEWRGQRVAIKTFNRFKDEAALLKEIQLLRDMGGHENIIKYYGWWRWDGKLCSIMEFMPWSMQQAVYDGSSYNTHSAFSWLQQAAKALLYLHELHIIHRDIKPHNMLLTDDRRTLKICDFGISRELTTEMTVMIGTPVWMAPEVLDNNSYDYKSDVYSLAITYWQIRSRRTILPSGNPFDHVRAVRDRNRRPIRFNGCDDEEWRFIQTMWQNDYTQRPTMMDVVAFATASMEKPAVLIPCIGNDHLPLFEEDALTKQLSGLVIKTTAVDVPANINKRENGGSSNSDKVTLRSNTGSTGASSGDTLTDDVWPDAVRACIEKGHEAGGSLQERATHIQQFISQLKTTDRFAVIVFDELFADYPNKHFDLLDEHKIKLYANPGYPHRSMISHKPRHICALNEFGHCTIIVRSIEAHKQSAAQWESFDKAGKRLAQNFAESVMDDGGLSPTIWALQEETHQESRFIFLTKLEVGVASTGKCISEDRIDIKIRYKNNARPDAVVSGTVIQGWI